MAGKAGSRGWGHIRKLPSGNLQASYIGPDLRRHTAPTTYTNSKAGKVRAEGWLAAERSGLAGSGLRIKMTRVATSVEDQRDRR